VPVHRLNIAGTSLLGVFIVGNDEKILIPNITFEHELEELKKLKIKFEVLKSKHTCLGNNIVLSKHGALVNNTFSDVEIKKIKEYFKVPVKRIEIADTETPGSDIIVNNGKSIIHKDASVENLKLIKKVLKIEVLKGTINMGSPYVKSGLLCNSNGLVIGDASGPAEVMNAEEGLGFINV
jgi:translation initiation factor 6